MALDYLSKQIFSRKKIYKELSFIKILPLGK